MDIKGRSIVITGAASGIGRGLAIGFHAAGAAHIACADLNLDGAQETADMVGGSAHAVDVADEAQVSALIATVDADHPIDIFCANAGILTLGGVDAPNEAWQKIWDINVMSQVYAARHVIPRMAERGGGYILNTASAAGLLNQVGAAPYGVTKHASVGLSEWLHMSHYDQGIRVSVLCPQAVRSAMTAGFEDSVASLDGLLEPEDVAAACIKAIEAETFLVLPHPEVGEYIKLKAMDYDRWLGGMRKLHRQFS